MNLSIENRAITSFFVAVALVITTISGAAPGDPEPISSVVGTLNKLHRVTETPHPMADSTAKSCTISYNSNIHEGSGQPAYCHVYVSQHGREALVSGNGNYPTGTVIVKSKLKNDKSKEAILYTVMRKMSRGYDSEHGDWEYSVLDGPSGRILASGKIDSCIACHQEYSASDYVTRAYMEDNLPKNK